MTKRRLFTAALLVLIAPFAALLLLLSKHGLSVTRLTLEFSGLPGLRRFQNSPAERPARLRVRADNARLIKAVAAEEPELIALTGDFLDEGEAGRELPGSRRWCELVKLAPVYFVSGNHDWASGAAAGLFETLGAAGVNCLRNDFLSLERGGDVLVLGGVEDPNGPADMEDAGRVHLAAAAPGAFTCCWPRAYWAERLRTSTWTSSSAATPTAA